MRAGKRTRMLFIIADKAKAWRDDVKSVGVVREKEVKLEDDEASHTLGGTGGEGVPKEREVERSREVCEWRGEREAINTQGCALARMLPTLDLSRE